MNNDLRWRKYPEEKPINDEPCICIEDDDFKTGEFTFARYSNEYWDQWRTLWSPDGREYFIDVVKFIPLSALPKV